MSRSKIHRLEQNVRELERMVGDRSSTTTSEWAFRYGVQESIQIVIDLACHLVSIRALGAPENYRGCIDILAEHGLLTTELAQSLRGMVGLRNLLIHQYDEIDINRLTPVLNRLDDFRAFARLYEQLNPGGTAAEVC